jgi:hypothetical protein
MTFTLPKRTQPGDTTLVPDLTMEWLHGGTIVAFTLTSSSYQVVEAYFAANFQLMDEAEKTPQNLMIMLHDISGKNVSLTPMLRTRLDEIAARIRQGQVHYRSAVILSNTPMSMVFSFFGNVFSRNAKNTIQKFFTARHQGIEWLKQYVSKTAET